MAVESPKVPLTNKPGVSNWVEKYGALKPKQTNWIRRAAEHMKGKGMADGHAIASAVNAAKKLCASGDLNFPGIQQANPGSRAEACAAVAKWEAAKARAKAARVSEAELAVDSFASLPREVRDALRIEEADSKGDGDVMMGGGAMKRCGSCGWKNPMGSTKCKKCHADLKAKGDPKDKRKVEEAALLESVEFDPALHPRDRVGHFVDVLGKLKVAGRVKLPGGVWLRKRRVSTPDSVESHYTVGTKTGRAFGPTDNVRAAAASAINASDQLRGGRTPGQQKRFDAATRRVQQVAQDRHRRLEAERVHAEEKQIEDLRQEYQDAIKTGRQEHARKVLAQHDEILVRLRGGMANEPHAPTDVTRMRTPEELRKLSNDAVRELADAGHANASYEWVRRQRQADAIRRQPADPRTGASLPLGDLDAPGGPMDPYVQAGVDRPESLEDKVKGASLSTLANMIQRDWGPNVNFAAKPYLDAMHSLNEISDSYGLDSGLSVVSYFLSNASSWRGDMARTVKAELRRRVKGR